MKFAVTSVTPTRHSDSYRVASEGFAVRWLVGFGFPCLAYLKSPTVCPAADSVNQSVQGPAPVGFGLLSPSSQPSEPEYSTPTVSSLTTFAAAAIARHYYLNSSYCKHFLDFENRWNDPLPSTVA